MRRYKDNVKENELGKSQKVHTLSLSLAAVILSMMPIRVVNHCSTIKIINHICFKSHTLPPVFPFSQVLFSNNIMAKDLQINDPLPKGYRFVKKGDAYITRHW
jgi:hypothetical protein